MPSPAMDRASRAFRATIGSGQWSAQTCVLEFSVECANFQGNIQAMLVLQINGKPRQLPPGSSVENLIATLQLEGKRFAIELNGEIVPKCRHALTRLNNGDALEVVVAVGGG